MSLVTVDEVRALVKTSLSDDELQSVIDREEDALIHLYGDHYVDDSTTVTETLAGGGVNLFLRRPVTSVTSCQEKEDWDDDWETLTEDDDFYVVGEYGMLKRATDVWGVQVRVTYVPVDDNDRRKAAIIELVRLAVERTAMRSEHVAGEYSFQAPDWELERVRILRRFGFLSII